STTSGLPAALQVFWSTKVGSDGVLCASRVTVGAAVMPLSLAQYSPVASADSTGPSEVEPSMTLPPLNGLIGSAVPLMIITGTGAFVGVQARFSVRGTLAEMA